MGFGHTYHCAYMCIYYYANKQQLAKKKSSFNSDCEFGREQRGHGDEDKIQTTKVLWGNIILILYRYNKKENKTQNINNSSQILSHWK